VRPRSGLFKIIYVPYKDDINKVLIYIIKEMEGAHPGNIPSRIFDTE
jgi:hypothetical protein